MVRGAAKQRVSNHEATTEAAAILRDAPSALLRMRAVKRKKRQ
jgi:hypothetical protein